MSAWIVLADEREAVVYEIDGSRDHFKLVHKAKTPLRVPAASASRTAPAARAAARSAARAAHSARSSRSTWPTRSSAAGNSGGSTVWR